MKFSGYTLLELLLVITSLAVVTGLTIPYVQDYVEEGKCSKMHFSKATIATDTTLVVTNEIIMNCPNCQEKMILTKPIKIFTPITCENCKNKTFALFPEIVQELRERDEISPFWSYILPMLGYLLGKTVELMISFIGSLAANKATKPV